MAKFHTPLQVFRGHSVWTAPLDSRSIVIDAGAHRGEFSALLQERFNCTCVLVEAHPGLAKVLVPPPLGKVVQAALAANSGVTRFRIRDNLEAGSCEGESSSSANTTVAVTAVSIKDLCKQIGYTHIHLLKLDIEGAEFELLERTPEAILKGIDQITVEFHDFLPAFKGQRLFERCRLRLRDLGFSTYCMAIRGHGDVLFLNRRRLAISIGQSMLIRLVGPFLMKLYR